MPMAKGRRTRKQRQQAVKHRQDFTYTLPTVLSKTKTVRVDTVKSGPKTSEGLFSYDMGLIRADLTKTLVLSILAVAAIVAIYWFRLL